MEKALNTLKDLCLVLNFNSYWKPRIDEAITELEEAMKPKTCETFDKGASSTNYPPKTIFAFGNFYTLKDTQC